MTARNPRRKTCGPAVAKISAALGRPFMPWQRAAANVAFEIDPDTGLFAYPLVIISVQRQAGKTALVLATGAHRCLQRPSRRVWYTAQTGFDARDNFLEMAEPAEGSLLAPTFDLKRGAANTSMQFANGSRFRAHPPTQGSLHGKQADLNLVDEPWEYTEVQGAALMAGITPAQSTRNVHPHLGAQTILLSTRGTAESTWFHGKIADAYDDPRVCLIDFGVPDGEDPTDLDVIARYHPAYGHTQDLETFKRARTQLPDADFIRGYANIETKARTALLPATVLDAAEVTPAIPADLPVVIAAAVSWERDMTAIVAAATVDGTPVAEVIADRPGTSWAADAIAALVAAQRPAAVLVDKVGPSATLHDELDRAGVDLLPFGGRDVGMATADLMTRLTDPAGPRVRWRPSPALRAEWNGVVMRDVADVGRVFSRRHSAGSIARVEALNLAVYGLSHLPEPEQPARMVFF